MLNKFAEKIFENFTNFRNNDWVSSLLIISRERKERLKRHYCPCGWGPGTSSARAKHVKRCGESKKSGPGGNGSAGPIHNDCPVDETPGQSSNAHTSLHIVARDGGGKKFVGDLSLVMEPNLRPLSPLASNLVSSQAEEASESESGTPSEPDHSSDSGDSD